MTPNKHTLKSLLERVKEAEGADRELDHRIHHALVERIGPMVFNPGSGEFIHAGVTAPNYTSSIDAALSLVERVLPGWGWRVASCHVSDDAFVFPDFNNPNGGKELMDRFPMPPEGDEWADYTDVDRRPPGNPALALLESMLIALIAQEGE